MRVPVRTCWLELHEGDITRQQVDLIVNAANTALAGGGGVDGAIHRRGGPAIKEETDSCHPLGCPTGSAVISGAGALAARFVAHAVGPVWRGGKSREPELLAGAIRRSLELALDYDCQSVALPALSTGVYGYPLPLAAEVSLNTALDFLIDHRHPKLVRFVLFGAPAFDVFASKLARLVEDRGHTLVQ